jgi:hypothetical protein
MLDITKFYPTLTKNVVQGALRELAQKRKPQLLEDLLDETCLATCSLP